MGIGKCTAKDIMSIINAKFMLTGLLLLHTCHKLWTEIYEIPKF